MLFNSFLFIFCFLPIVLVGFFALARISHKLAAGWLTVASLFFYGWWDADYLALLLASIGFNYVLGRRIARLHEAGLQKRSRQWLVLAIAANLILLGYFKYTIFFLSSLQTLGAVSGPLPTIVLPLGISFFTITQIAFLVDAHRGQARDYSLTHYMLFVTYFPHLIAGPILHHREMMPQFDQRSTYRLNWDSIAVGLTMFVIGLFKKTVIADELAGLATPAFNAAAAGHPLTLLEAWGAALAYTFQIYFDFSGYTDMALGASRMFGIVLPLNFCSPYKATSIIDFWRRWHITLVALPARLRVHRAWRKSHFECRALQESAADDVDRRSLARCLVDLRVVGRPARLLSGHQPWLAIAEEPSHDSRAAGRARARHTGDVCRRGHRLGVFPRDRLHIGGEHPGRHGGTKWRPFAGAMAVVRWAALTGGWPAGACASEPWSHTAA